jgi:hypothetical protein
MKLFSLLRRIDWRFREQSHPRKKRSRATRSLAPSTRALLSLESLESRDLLTVPTIVSVTPADGSTLTASVSQINITFSEPMQAATITNLNNYKLFDSGGVQVAFANAQASNNNTVVTLNLPAGQLPVGNFQLFARGDQLLDQDEGQPIAKPGQLVTANLGTGKISTFAMPGNDTLGAVSNYPSFTQGLGQSTPVAATVADLDGDGHNDLVTVVSSTFQTGTGLPATDALVIFAGLPTGGYAALPTVALALPVGANATGLVVADFNGDGKPDIAVSDGGTNDISLFLNGSTGPGDFTFPTLNSIAIPAAAGTNPVGIVSGNFSGTGRPDLAVVNAGANGANNFTVLFLQNNFTAGGGGGFTTNLAVPVGDTSGNFLGTPTGLAVGHFHAGVKDDVVVSGAAGVSVLESRGAVGTLSFNNFQTVASLFVAGPNTTSVATGLIRAGATGNAVQDIAATSTAAAGNLIVPFINDGLGNFTATAGFNAGVNNPAAIALKDLENTGKPEAIFLGNNTQGTLNVLPSLLAGPITAVADPAGGTITITTTPNNGLVNNDVVNIGGAQGDPGVNGTFFITNVNQAAGTFDLVNSSGNGGYTGGGAWVLLPGIISNVTNAGPGNTGLITITSPGHGLITGQQVTIRGVLGDTAANGTFTVTRIDANRFSLNGSNGNGAFVASTNIANPPRWTLTPYAVDANPTGLTFGDANGDGILDAVVVNSKGQDVSVLPGGGANGVGNGTFVQSIDVSVAPAAQPNAVAVGDLNGDGIPDLVAVNTGTNSVSVFLGLPGGGYAAPATYSTVAAGVGRSPVAVTLADMNRDGRLDIVTADSLDNRVSVLLNSKTTPGTFGPATTYVTGQNPTAVVAADLNNDGTPDLIVAHNGGGTASTRGVSILLGNGDGTFKAPSEVASGVHAVAVAAADFNKDGNMDIVVADNNPTGPGQVDLLLGNGNGTFASKGAFTVGVNPVDLAVGDFNADGFPDVVTVSSSPTTSQNISVLLNQAGTGFGQAVNTSMPAGFPLGSVTVANVNQDAFPDIIVGQLPGRITSVVGTTITVPNNNLRTGDVITVSGVLDNVGGQQVPSPINGTWVVSVSIFNPSQLTLINANPDSGYIQGSGVEFSSPGTSGAGYNNLYTLTGNGDGTFLAPKSYMTGGSAFQVPAPGASSVSVVSDPFLHLSTFFNGGNLVRNNLITNGGFEAPDLSGERGNLNGWKTFDQNIGSTQTGSAGAFSPQTGTSSPLSLVTVPLPPQGLFSAMLDEPDQIPLFNGLNQNLPASYAGAHALYQDVVIPSDVQALTLSFTLFIDDSGSTLASPSNPGGFATPNGGTLDFTQPVANQQVRVDLVNPSANIEDVGSGVVQNFFQTDSTQPAIQTVNVTHTFTATEIQQLLQSQALSGGKLRFRLAVANNQGKILVGLDNVRMVATYADTGTPVLVNLKLRDPNYLTAPNNTAQSVDPTITGTVGDTFDGPGSNLINGVNNIRFVAFDVNNTGNFKDPSVVKITSFDATGNFSFTVPGLLPGVYSIPVEVVDQVGLVNQQTFTFTVQGPSQVTWQQNGPGSTDISAAGLNYTKVTGNVTSVLPDPSDKTGSTIYIGSDNGGVWKTTDGGNDWHVLTDHVLDANNNLVPETIGALAAGQRIDGNGVVQLVLYAGTGVANTNFVTGGDGILLSINSGLSWSVVGQSTFQGAHISKIVVDPNNSSIAYVAVAWFDDPSKQPGVFFTNNQGQTWTNIFTPANMHLLGDPNGPTLPAGTPIASVTDMIIDPSDVNDRLVIGVGEIGKTPGAAAAPTATSTEGVWVRTNDVPGPGVAQNRWVLQTGGKTAGIRLDTVPNGQTPFNGAKAQIGRISVAVAQPNIEIGGEHVFYVLVANPPVTPPPRGQVTLGDTNPSSVTGVAGLYKTKDNFLDFTHVMVRQEDPGSTFDKPSFLDLDMTGNEGANVGSLAVDPTNANVVYVGGSDRFHSFVRTHGFIRVDTGDMRDATFEDPLAGTPYPQDVPNDGDDIQKANQAELIWLKNHQAAVDPNFYGEYPPGPTVNAPLYTTENVSPGTKPNDSNGNLGEGVYWYDLSEGPVSGPFPGSFAFLPTAINSLAFDPQGRLLVGTVNGIWRGIGFGFGYDYTSGGSLTGILARPQFGQTQPIPPGMNFTSLNGNLQITDLTSVAVDPTTPNTFYSTQLNSGSAMTSSGAVQSWISLGGLGGLTGPADQQFGNLGVPSAGEIRAVLPSPAAPPGTPTTLYRTWQFEEQPTSAGTLVQRDLEVSANGGGTFTSTTSSGIQSGDFAALNIPFAIKPTKVNGTIAGQFFDQIVLGTDRVYLSNTSGNAWTPVSGRLSPNTLGPGGTDDQTQAPKGVVTAVAIAPSTLPGNDIFVAGTSDGKVFYYNPAAGFVWVNRSPTLPGGSRINGLTFDPSDPNTIYAMVTTSVPFGGGVFKTTNGGMTWSPLTGLPAQPAYALVVDSRTPQTARTLYVGTQVGVFKSMNGGATWAPLSQALPAAPVVDIQLNQNLNELAAAVQGRGVFVLSTQTHGPQVVADTPTTVQNTPLTNLTVTFNEAVDPRTFTLASNQQARANVAAALTTSPEGLANRAAQLFVTYLRRAASGPEATAYASVLAETTAVAQQKGAANADADVVSQLLASVEYFTNPSLGNSNNQTWLNQVYIDLFGRLPNGTDPTASQLNTLNTVPGQLGRLIVAYGMTANDEYVRNLIAGLNNQFLGTNFSRPAPANDAGINSLVTLLDNAATNGVTVQLIIAGFLSGNAYYSTGGELTGASAGIPAAAQQGATPSAVAYGNFTGAVDGHGKPIEDLAVLDSVRNTVSIYKGQLGGTYSATPALVLTLPAGANAKALVVADLNNDGLLDIAVANTGLSAASGQSVSVFLNTTVAGGPITFAARTDYNGGDNPTGIVATDVNGDNVRDLAVVDGALDATNHYDLNVLIGSPITPGTFALPITIAIGTNAANPGPGELTKPTGLAVGDFNQDGKNDLAISGGNGLAVLLNTSTLNVPNFAPLATRLTNLATTSVAVAAGTTSAATGSGTLDHSGIAEIAATTDVGNAVLVFQNNGAATPVFTMSSFAAGNLPRSVQLADLNGDGLADIVVVNDTAAGTLTVLRNTTTFVPAGQGTETVSFAPPVTYGSLGANPVSLALADTNQDRLLDAAVANSGSDTFAVIPGMTPGTFRTASDPVWLQGVYQQLFHRPADSTAFNAWLPQLPNASLVYLQGPAGNASPLSITPTDATNQTFQLTFAPQVLDGTYTLFLGVTNTGAAVKDLIDFNGTFVNSGNAMNQNGNAVNGEFPADRFVGQFAINTSDNGPFVTGLYHDLFGLDQTGRPADTNGFVAFVGQVDAARFRVISQFAASFVSSVENVDININDVFTQGLLRPAGPTDLAVWQTPVQSGQVTEQALLVNVIASAENFTNPALGNSSNATWVDSLYRIVLGRSSLNDPGAPLYVAFLNANSGTPAQALQARVFVATRLVYSTEGLSRVVYNTFLRFLDRAPNSAEIPLWVGFLSQAGVIGQATPFQRFEGALVSSQEFFTTVGNNNRAWTIALYSKLLKRGLMDPNGAEVTGLLQALVNGYQPDRAAVINTALSTIEYQNRLLTRDFVAYLSKPGSQRIPTAAELAAFEGAFIPPGIQRDDFWVSLIVAGPEFHDLGGGDSSNQDWLNQVYNALLFRPADSSALNPNNPNSFISQLDAAGNNQAAVQAARQRVAQQILASLEYRRDLVASLFNRFLDRSKPLMQTGADAEVNAYANLMFQSGFSQEQISDLLMAGQEYLQEPHLFP